MPDREEVLSALSGAYRLAWFDTSGMGYFNLTVEGFWRSFFAAVLVAPAYLVLIVWRRTAQTEGADPGLVVVVEMLAYVAAWLAFPLAAIVLTRLLGQSRNYVPLVIARNWATVLQTALFLTVLLLGSILPTALGTLLVVLSYAAILVYTWFVIRTALQTTGGIALMLLLVDVVLGRLIETSVIGLL